MGGSRHKDEYHRQHVQVAESAFAVRQAQVTAKLVSRAQSPMGFKRPWHCFNAFVHRQDEAKLRLVQKTTNLYWTWPAVESTSYSRPFGLLTMSAHEEGKHSTNQYQYHQKSCTGTDTANPAQKRKRHLPSPSTSDTREEKEVSVIMVLCCFTDTTATGRPSVEAPTRKLLLRPTTIGYWD